MLKEIRVWSLSVFYIVDVHKDNILMKEST